MGRLEVGNADRPDLAGLDQLLERLPGGDILVPLGKRPVDQEQINVVQAKLTQALVETSNRTWAARQIDHGAALSNRVSLGTDWTRASDDVAPGTDFDDYRWKRMPTTVADGRLAPGVAVEEIAAALGV